MSRNYAVIGLGFGDEGKGSTVNSLCKEDGSQIVVRYNGGQQAGHTVTLEDGTSHVFSNFGSGTLKGVPTYWSEFCSFDPVGVINELAVLKNKTNKQILLYVNKKCPITTPFEKYENQNSETMNHGTCGAGVGTTFAREEKFYSLTVNDLLYPSILRTKLELIKTNLYYWSINGGPDVTKFLDCCDLILHHPEHFQLVDDKPNRYGQEVYEGAQGLMLDQNIGFFPHVTRSNTGTPNIKMISDNDVSLFLITRAFQTRHGNGPMTNEKLPHNITENPKETNILNKFQGNFRKTLLDLDLLRYGMEKDEGVRTTPNRYRTLVVTCLDLVRNEYRYTVGGKIVAHTNEKDFLKGIARYLGIAHVRGVASPTGAFEQYYFGED